MADLEGAYDLFGPDPVQASADAAAALRAVGRTSEDAGFDAAFEVGGIVGGHFREEAIVRIFRRVKKGLPHATLEQKFGIFFVKYG
jgi:hypothetical protein